MTRPFIKKTNYMFIFSAVGGIFFFFTAAGCAPSSSREVSPLFELPEAFSTQGMEQLPEKWWQSFNDPLLDAVMELALYDNFTIRSAWDRLTQAEQIAIQTGAALFPAAVYEGTAARTSREVSGSTSHTSRYSAALAASYEVDLWGRIQSARQAAVLDAQAAREDVSAAAMTLSAAIARTWYQLAEARQQETVIDRQIEANQKILEVVILRFRQGQVGAADVFSQEQLVHSSRGQLIQAQETTALLEHLLSVLAGKPPKTRLSEQPAQLAEPGSLPYLDIPAVVIQRRPDVAAAFTTVQSADRRLASAIADQYPAVSLFASVETPAPQISGLFDDWLSNLSANLTGPLFDAGFRKAEAARRRAVLSQALNEYSQSVLEALQETEDALSQEFYQRQFAESLQQQLALARQVYDRTYQNYLKGQLDYLRVLTALVSLQRLEQSELAARRVLLERRIDLCRSIAGGWPLPRPQDTVH